MKSIHALAGLTLATLLAFSISACGGRQIILQDAKPSTKAGVLSIWVNSIKDKGKKYDLSLSVKNERDASSIIYLSQIECFRGPQQGVLKHTFFNTGERTIDFKPGELKTFKMVCNLGASGSGDYRVKVGSIYDNPTNDGKTPGKVIDKGMEWKTAVAPE